MKPITVTTVIERPLEAVFSAFSDFEKMPKVLHSALSIEFLSTNTSGLGCEWVQVSDDPPVRATHKIVAFEPPHRFAMTSDDRTAFETMTFQFKPEGMATQTNFTVEMQPKIFLAKLLGTFFRRVIQKEMEADLLRMKLHIETGD